MGQRKDFLKELLNCVTVSGCEEEGGGCIKKYMRETADEIQEDEIGDVVCVINPESERKILATAHLDEIGLLVTAVTDQGRLLVIRRGGIVPATYPGHSVLVRGREKDIFGVVESCRDLFKKEELRTSDFLIDIGAESKEEAERLVEPGACAVFDTSIREMAGGRFSARALDDRLGVFIIMEAMRKAKEKGCKAGIFCAATVGEETTKNGAYWTASRINPDLAVVVDVTYTSDSTGMNVADSGQVKLGGGPVLCNGPLVVKKLNEQLRCLAKKAGIPVQTEAASNLSYTDMDKIHFAGDGIPTVLVSIPLRYMHHPSEVADERDVQNCIDLLAGFFAAWE